MIYLVDLLYNTWRSRSLLGLQNTVAILTIQILALSDAVGVQILCKTQMGTNWEEGWGLWLSAVQVSELLLELQDSVCLEMSKSKVTVVIPTSCCSLSSIETRDLRVSPSETVYKAGKTRDLSQRQHCPQNTKDTQLLFYWLARPTR